MCATARRAFSRWGQRGVPTVSPFTRVKEYSHAIDEGSVESVIRRRLARVGYARMTRPCRRIRQGVVKRACAEKCFRHFRASLSKIPALNRPLVFSHISLAPRGDSFRTIGDHATQEKPRRSANKEDHASG